MLSLLTCIDKYYKVNLESVAIHFYYHFVYFTDITFKSTPYAGNKIVHHFQSRWQHVLVPHSLCLC